MKKLVLFSLLSFSGITGIFAQGNSCAQATPFCEAPGGAGVTFPNSVGVSAPAGPSYGCLNQQPNPAYFFIKTSAAGNMVYNISQVDNFGFGIDVDFIAWGPFTTYSSMCNNLTGSCSPGGTALPQTCTGNIEDCSYSTSATEVMTLVSPGAGYYYLIMITNYEGVSGNITFSQTGGPASDCSITCPSALSGDGFLLTDGVTPVPSTIACGAAPFGIMASPNSAFGTPIVPGVMVSFQNNNNTSNQISWYEDGAYLGCFGPTCGTFSLTPNTNTDLQWSYSSPSAVTTFTLCENNTAQPNMTFTVTNLATHNVLQTGTWTDDGACQTITIPAGQITGVATFTASCGACITSTDYGYASFSPSAAGPGTHTITYTFAPGGTCTPYTFSKVITINQPTVSAAASATTICQGSSSTLTASGTPSTPTVTFTNTNDFAISTSGTPSITSPISVTGLSGTVGATLLSVNLNIAHTYDSELTIRLQCPNGTIINLSAGNGGSNDNYINTTFATGGTPITSGAAPFTGTYAPQQAFSGLSGCNLNGTWNLLVSDAANGDGGALYDWSITFSNQNTYTWAPTGSLSASSGTSVTATPTVTTIYTVTATDASGCSRTNTVQVNVNPIPTASVTAGNSQTVCAGNNSTLVTFSSNPAGATYSWTASANAATAGSTTSGTSTIPVFTASNVASQTIVTYSVTASLGGCPNPAPFVYTVTVNPRPTIASTSTTVCNGQSATITASGNSNTYSWNTGASGANLTINPATATTTYTVTGTITATACTNTVTGTITVNPLPPVASTSTTVCNGQSATITGSGATTYTWSTGASGANLTINPATTTTTYTVTGTNTATTCTNTATGTITVNPLPSVASTSTTVCRNQSATITASGTATTYTWSTGATGTNLTINPATATTTYTVTGTGGNGCTNTATGTINVNNLPSVSATSTTVCNGQSATITASGTATTYTWSTGATSTNLTINPATTTTTYTVTGTSAATCTNTATGTITVNPLPTVAATSTTVCNGQSATITGSGANTYAWNTGASGANLTINPATATTNYTVTGTNTTTNCTNTAVGTITVNALPTVAATSTTVCNGQSATITGSGANTYAWNTGASGANLTINPATTTTNYTVTGTNTTTSCTNTAVGTITVNPVPTISLASSPQPSVCSGGTVNAISFNASPGASISWTTNSGAGLPASGSTVIPGYTAPTVTVATVGSYTAIATYPSTGCSSTLAPVTGSFTVNPNPVITTGTATVTPSNCGGSTGAIAGVTATGTPTLSYQWSSGQTTADISNVPAGSYNLVVTDGNNCTSSAAFSIGNPGAPQNPSVSVNSSPNAAICEGGSATFNIVNAAGGVTYNWFGPGGISLGSGTTITVTNATLADGGNYTASATAAGCTGAQSDTAAVLVVNPNPVPQVTPTGTNSFCSDATFVLSASASNPGGTATIPSNGYQWTLGGTPINGATSLTYTATVAGTYGLSITNSNGCSATASTNITLNNFSEPVLGTPTSVVNSNCVTPSGTVVGMGISGGSPGYTYTWYNASSAAISTSTTTPDLDSVAAGTYTLIVVDGNGCNDTTSVTILNDNAPNAPSINGTNPANCSGSTNAPITITNAGGSINWYSDPALTNVIALDTITYTPVNTVTDTLYVTETNNGCQSTSTQVIITVNQTPAAPVTSNVSVCQGGTVPDLTATVNLGTINWYDDINMVNPPLASGSPFASGATTTTTYYVGATNLNCVGPLTPVTVFINTPANINVSTITIDSASCGGLSDGNITGIMVGGTPSFTYVWSNASGTVSTSTTSPNLANQQAGTYTLTVTDGNNCISSYGPVTLNSTAVPPTPVFVTASDTVYCAGDAVTALTVNASSGNVFWYSDAGLTNQIGIGNTYTPTTTTTTTVYVVANNSNCVSTPLPVSLTFNPLPTVGGNSPTTCAGGSVTLSGTGAASYTWSGGINDGVSFVPVSTNNYVVTGTDLNGCVNTATVTVTVNTVPTVGATQGSSTATCAGSTITLSGTGASTYVWTGGISDGVAFTPATSGNYTVTGTDGNNCSNTFTVAVTVNPLPTVDAGASSATIPCGSTNFVLTGATTNATSPLYAWTGPNVVANASASAPTIGGPGTYTLVVTDAATGCSAQDMISVISNGVSASFTQDVTSGFNPLTVNFTNTSVGATSYSWSFGDGNISSATDPTNVFTAMGTYQAVLVAFSNGCSDTAMVTIVVEDNSSIVIPNIFSPNGDGTNDFLTIASTGIQEMNIDIFNRWGQKVYVITGPGQSWDGKLSNGQDAAEGTYFYLLKAVGYDKKEYERQGPVMLVK